ncbi:MAG: Mov34/MPN/PAD-1 family protein [Nitrospinota bacterium]
MECFIAEQAFISLLVSSIEVYKKECYGLLLGNRQKERWIVRYAVPYQSAERSQSEVRWNHRRDQRIRRFLTRLPDVELLGDFHSHTALDKKLSVTPSKVDLQGMKREEIYLIVGIDKKLKLLPWGNNRDGTLSGTVDDFVVKIRAYYQKGKAEPNPKWRYAKVVCPFATGFHS